METPKEFVGLITKIVVTVIVLVLLSSVFGIVQTGKVGVKTRLGRVVGTVNSGPYLKLPILESVHKMDTKTRTINYDKNGNEGDSVDSPQLLDQW